MGEHDGHRQRLRGRFLREGLDGFDDHNVLELLLFFSQPRKDTNLLAHQLMDTFGSLDKVFEAAPEKLMELKGIGENAAALIHLVPEAGRRYLIAKETLGEPLNSVERIGRFLIPRFMNCREETVYLICLDAGLKVLDCSCLGSGGTTSTHINIRKILETVIIKNATYAILAHNHTSGIALPSPEDETATLLVRDALSPAGVSLLDHIIVAGEDFVSLADDGVLNRPSMWK